MKTVKRIRTNTGKVREAIEKILAKNLTDLNHLLKAAGTVSIEQVGVKQKSENKRKDTLWKRTLEEVSTNGERMLII